MALLPHISPLLLVTETLVCMCRRARGVCVVNDSALLAVFGEGIGAAKHNGWNLGIFEKKYFKKA